MATRRGLLLIGALALVVGAVGLVVAAIQPISFDVTVGSDTVAIARSGRTPAGALGETRTMSCGFPLGPAPSSNADTIHSSVADACGRAMGDRRVTAVVFGLLLLLGLVAIVASSRRKPSSSSVHEPEPALRN